MSVILESVIKSNDIGRWYIEIRDTLEEDKTAICYDIDEYSKKVEEMGAEYGPDVQVVWSQEENVTEIQLYEVHMQMMAYEQKLEDKEQKPEE